MNLTTKARNLRKNQTDVEQILWQQLRSRQLLNCKFRRQMPFAPYIVDFVCLDHHLIIELDGSQHQEQKTYDEKRSAFLQNHGFTVLRFWNNEVIENLAGVLGNWKQITHPPYLSFCPPSVLLLRLHSLLCALHNKTEGKQKYLAKWVGYLFPVALEIIRLTLQKPSKT